MLWLYIWGHPHIGYNDFIVSPYGAGWRLDRVAFNNISHQAIRLGCKLLFGSRFVSSTKLSNKDRKGVSGHRLNLFKVSNRIEQIDTKYVVDASGSSARFAASLGVRKN